MTEFMMGAVGMSFGEVSEGLLWDFPHQFDLQNSCSSSRQCSLLKGDPVAGESPVTPLFWGIAFGEGMSSRKP